VLICDSHAKPCFSSNGHIQNMPRSLPLILALIIFEARKLIFSMTRNYLAFFLAVGIISSTALAQGEYCARLVNDDNYYDSMQDAINCYMDVGNYREAIGLINTLVQFAEDMASEPGRFSSMDERDAWLKRVNLTANLNRRKSFCLHKAGNADEGIKVLNEAIESLVNVEFPYSNNEKLHHQLQVLNQVKDTFEGWSSNWAYNDSLRLSTFQFVQDVLGYQESYDLFLLEYPPISYWEPSSFGARMAIEMTHRDCTLQMARVVLSTCSGEDCLRALSALEYAKSNTTGDDGSCYDPEILYWIGLTHLLSNNEGLGCQSIEAACNLENAHEVEWGLAPSLTQQCNCDLD